MCEPQPTGMFYPSPFKLTFKLIVGECGASTGTGYPPPFRLTLELIVGMCEPQLTGTFYLSPFRLSSLLACLTRRRALVIPLHSGSPVSSLWACVERIRALAIVRLLPSGPLSDCATVQIPRDQGSTINVWSQAQIKSNQYSCLSRLVHRFKSRIFNFVVNSRRSDKSFVFVVFGIQSYLSNLQLEFPLVNSSCRSTIFVRKHDFVGFYLNFI